METINNTVDTKVNHFKNPIKQMVEDKKRIIQAIINGESVSKLKGIKIASPL